MPVRETKAVCSWACYLEKALKEGSTVDTLAVAQSGYIWSRDGCAAGLLHEVKLKNFWSAASLSFSFYHRTLFFHKAHPKRACRDFPSPGGAWRRCSFAIRSEIA